MHGLDGTGARQFTISCGLMDRLVVAKFSVKFFILKHSAAPRMQPTVHCAAQI